MGRIVHEMENGKIELRIPVFDPTIETAEAFESRVMKAFDIEIRDYVDAKLAIKGDQRAETPVHLASED